jgi:hypothetical protein
MNLELRNEETGLRHYLNGRPVHCGDQLRLLVSSGSQPEFYVWARYEAHLGSMVAEVFLYTTFGTVRPDEGTILRWPKDGE